MENTFKHLEMRNGFMTAEAKEQAKFQKRALEHIRKYTEKTVPKRGIIIIPDIKGYEPVKVIFSPKKVKIVARPFGWNRNERWGCGNKRSSLRPNRPAVNRAITNIKTETKNRNVKIIETPRSFIFEFGNDIRALITILNHLGCTINDDTARWQDLMNHLIWNEFEDEYLSLIDYYAESEKELAEAFVWDKVTGLKGENIWTSAIACYWVVGGSEGYYVHIQPIFGDSKFRFGATRAMGITGKFWDKDRAEACVNTAQRWVNSL